MRFTSTPRGARLARRLVSHRLNDWGHPCTSAANEALTLIAAELTANAVRHGHVPGRDFDLRLTLTDGTFRIEVTDTRAEKQPSPASPSPDGIRPRPPPRGRPRGRLGRNAPHVRAGQDSMGGAPPIAPPLKPRQPFRPL
ncbi:ATP-binding protein [Streptomyces sp. NPDC086549]|uniref:ATP-binding protein n=1 Tax=Streptomyces sp. NPDC086549 TaxID=3365752 RepID=UPI00380D63A9